MTTGIWIRLAIALGLALVGVFERQPRYMYSAFAGSAAAIIAALLY